jgi:serine phosphatase RsbU (regulator of sigma subunit)
MASLNRLAFACDNRGVSGMPFLPSPSAISACNCAAAARCQAYRNSRRAGDAVFCELNRGDDRVMFLLVDVMGHGDSASRYVDLLNRQLRATENLSPKQLLGRLHGMLAPVWAEEDVYVCATAITPDASGSISVANAGLPPPLFGVIGDSAQIWNEAPDGAPLGLPEADATFDERRLQLSGGAALFFTDGVTEAYRPSDDSEHLEFFGYDRLQSLWSFPVQDDPRAELIERLYAALAQFAGADWPQDDVTTLCFEIRP